MRLSLPRWLCGLVFVAGLLAQAPAVSAQSLGAFYWRLAPYCNVVMLSVTQHVTPPGAVYQVTGVDDRCGAGERSAITGTAAFNLDGSLVVGLTFISAPGAMPSHLSAHLTLPTLVGPWADSSGNAGTFVPFTGTTSGAPRPTSVPGIGTGATAWGRVVPLVDDSPLLAARSPNVAAVDAIRITPDDYPAAFCITFTEPIARERRHAAVVGYVSFGPEDETLAVSHSPFFLDGREVCADGLVVASFQFSGQRPPRLAFSFIVP